MMKRNTILLGALALVLVLCVSIGTAYAYFTTYAAAQGGYVIRAGVDFEESFYDWTKRVVITSRENTMPVYVRARAYAGTTLTLQISGESWTQAGDWWYYTPRNNDGTVKPLNGGESTTELDIKILNIPTDVEGGDSFNVAVVYEYAPVRYDEAGSALPYNSQSIWYAPTQEGGNS